MLTKKDVLNLFLELLKDCSVCVNDGNMELYDESPDSVVDIDQLEKNINEALKEC